MTYSTKKTGLRINTGVKAGGLSVTNHNRRALRVRAGVKAGGLSVTNHNRRALKAD